MTSEKDVQGRRHHPTGKDASKSFRPEHLKPSLHAHDAIFPHHR
jgi:hypothetical protein